MGLWLDSSLWFLWFECPSPLGVLMNKTISVTSSYDGLNHVKPITSYCRFLLYLLVMLATDTVSSGLWFSALCWRSTFQRYIHPALPPAPRPMRDFIDSPSTWIHISRSSLNHIKPIWITWRQVETVPSRDGKCNWSVANTEDCRTT